MFSSRSSQIKLIPSLNKHTYESHNLKTMYCINDKCCEYENSWYRHIIIIYRNFSISVLWAVDPALPLPNQPNEVMIDNIIIITT